MRLSGSVATGGSVGRSGMKSLSADRGIARCTDCSASAIQNHRLFMACTIAGQFLKIDMAQVLLPLYRQRGRQDGMSGSVLGDAVEFFPVQDDVDRFTQVERQGMRF